MDYLTIEQGRVQSGLLLVLTRGVPGPWGEAAKALFRLHGLEFKPVQQLAGDPNLELVEWTGHRNAPIALYEDEAPRVHWLQILGLAERLGTGPSLIPDDRAERMFMIGLINEIAGEGGLAWNARALMFRHMVEAHGPGAGDNPMFQDYLYSAEAAQSGLTKIEGLLEYLASHMKAQQETGSGFLVGDAFTAADVYWAYFSNMLQTLPQEQCPVPEGLRKTWGILGQSVSSYDPIIIEQRDRIFADHLTLPLDF
jgi:hypothetical protein